MSTVASDQFIWEVQPTAARWVAQAIDALAKRNPEIGRLAVALRDHTGTRFVDWVDHLALGNDEIARLGCDLSDIGYLTAREENRQVWRHPLGMFPPVLVDSGQMGLGLRVESMDDFLAAVPTIGVLTEKRAVDVIGQRVGPFRTAQLCGDGGVSLLVVERHGYQGFNEQRVEQKQIEAAAGHLGQFLNRRRAFATVAEGYRHASELFAAAAGALGPNWACDLFFAAEREYWLSRNDAARVQFDRQNRFGLGWANHDHHTYRSSRAAFQDLIAILEQMGFQCRERFYAGSEAGWGAQVIEQPECRVVIFADVDLSPEEVTHDFAHQPLPERETLGTVGLWCELHGEAFLDAGMHHLECQFDFDAARTQLAAVGVETMAPFTDFPHLKQAFTRGQMWPVDPRRIERLLAQGRISSEQAERFRREGAIGSHLEILERNDGYKGFNQTGISEIITRTDPRRIIGA